VNRVAVVGSGAWGTVFAKVAADAGNSVRVLARRPEVARAIQTRRRHPEALDGIELPRRVRAGTDPAWALRGADIVAVAVGAQMAGTVAARIRPHVPGAAIALSLMKGIELGSGKRMSEVLADGLGLGPERVAALSGPNLSREIAEGQPAATVVACPVPGTAERVARAIATAYLRPYTNTDIVGVELSGAVKNVIAFAVGAAEGLGYSMNTCATLLTRGLAEMTRLGLALGADLETFAGLAGVGDLTATCFSPKSRNRTVGVLVGRGVALDDAVARAGGTAESIKSSAAILDLAHAHGVEMPITAGVVGAVHRGLPVVELGEALLARPHRAEGADYATWA
jgi:glycerol-3-phosphate dehydrogenase (NAD(P)+)